jgi:hypothetical protein
MSSMAPDTFDPMLINLLMEGKLDWLACIREAYSSSKIKQDGSAAAEQ